MTQQGSSTSLPPLAADISTFTANPVARDVGNIALQGRVVSKTVQYQLFTNNRNAVWAGRNQLMKESYPLAKVSFPANRKVFDYEVGDPFLFNCAEYGISGMVMRVAQITEDNPESEQITIQAIQDPFSVVNPVTAYEDPIVLAQQPTSLSEFPFANATVLEAPYALVGALVEVLPFAAPANLTDSGFELYMSLDGGASYEDLTDSTNIVPCGLLVGSYPADTYTIDEEGFTVNIVDPENAPAWAAGIGGEENEVITSTWAEILAGSANLAILGSEIISFLTATPITPTQFKLQNVVRGRYGTQKQDHENGETLYIVSGHINPVSNAEIVPGVTRQFKLVPYSATVYGDISEALVISLPIEGVALTPYIPINFNANGRNFAARYDDDIVLTWSPRVRGTGAGLGVPGSPMTPQDTFEGLFTIEVWVGGVLVRTITAIDDLTFTYTEAMNVADNTALASEVTFKLSNYIVNGQMTYTSGQVSVVCYQN